jgi:hypothetical protein
MSSLTTRWSETTFVAAAVHLGALLHAPCVCRTIVCAQWVGNMLWLSSRLSQRPSSLQLPPLDAGPGHKGRHRRQASRNRLSGIYTVRQDASGGVTGRGKKPQPARLAGSGGEAVAEVAPSARVVAVDYPCGPTESSRTCTQGEALHPRCQASWPHRPAAASLPVFAAHPARLAPQRLARSALASTFRRRGDGCRACLH